MLFIGIDENLRKRWFFDVAGQMNVNNIDAMLELLTWSLAKHTHDTFTYLLLIAVPSINTYRTWDRIQWISVHNYRWKRSEYCSVYNCLPVCRRTSSRHKWKIEWMKSSRSMDYTIGEIDLYFKHPRLRIQYLAGLILSPSYTLLFLVRAIKFSVTTHQGQGKILESLPLASQEGSVVKCCVIPVKRRMRRLGCMLMPLPSSYKIWHTQQPWREIAFSESTGGRLAESTGIITLWPFDTELAKHTLCPNCGTRPTAHICPAMQWPAGPRLQTRSFEMYFSEKTVACLVSCEISETHYRYFEHQHI